MSLPLMFVGSGVIFVGLVFITTTALEHHHWQNTLQAFRLSFSHDLTLDAAAHWLTTIAAATHPPQQSLFPLAPVVLEVLATHQGIAHYILMDPSLRGKLLAGIQATLPGARLEEDKEYPHTSQHLTVAQEITITSRTRPLAWEHAESVSTSVVAALQPLRSGEQIILQVIMTSAGTPSPVSNRQGPGKAATHWWFVSSASTAAEALRAERLKQRDPLLVATLRIGANAATKRQATALLSRPWSMLQGLNAPGVLLVQRALPSILIRSWLRARWYPLFYWPLLLNVREASALLAFPFGAHLPGLTLGRARQLPPSPTLPEEGSILGVSDYPGLGSRVLALHTADRLRHVHVVGPTGTGKSTLLAQMALQDITSGYGVVVIDLKGDLVNDIAARVPPDRRADVILLNPTQSQPVIIGFNPLGSALEKSGDESAQELIAEQVLAIFHSIYREFWGPRTDEILRAALFSLVHTDAPDGSAFTMIELPEVLTNPRFRQYLCTHPRLPDSLRAFWQWFDGSLKPSDQVQATGPVLNKLRAFSMRESIRLMLGQSQGMTLDHVVRNGRVLLLSLAKGALGSEAAYLLGSLFVASLWHTTQARIMLPPEQRHPIFAYLDEFQEVVRLEDDTSLTDMLAQARGLGLSLALAHQYLGQLPRAVREATLGTVRTHITFQLEAEDARALEEQFVPLTRHDLAGLSPYTFAIKPCVDGQTLAPVTGTTLPLGKALYSADELAWASRDRYGMAQAAIEAGLRARLGTSGPIVHGRFGREVMGGSA